jgi:hypothetical protein
MIGKAILHYRIIEKLGVSDMGRLQWKAATYSDYGQRAKSLSVA